MEVSATRGCREGNSSPKRRARQGRMALSASYLGGLLICYKGLGFTG